MKSFFYATAMLTGAIIGVGIFGIPYVSSRAGFWVGEWYIILLSVLVLTLHLCYGEIVERTQESHRIVGYARKYLGKNAERISFFLALATGYTALLLYVIAAGKFLTIITQNGIPAFLGSILFWLLGVYALWRGVRFIGPTEFFMTGFLVLALSIVIGRGIPLVHTSNLTPANPSQFLLPYGVILFSLMGTFAIPEMRPLLDDGRRYAVAIIAGTMLPALIYFLFNFAVVGVSGTRTTTQALEGVIPMVGETVAWIGALAGFLAITTSYFAFSLNLKHMLMYDLHVHRVKATLLIAVLPGILFLLGLQQFIAIMSVAGAVLGAMVSIVILLVYLRAKKMGDRKPAFSLGIPAPIVYTIAVAMAIAGAYQIFYWVR